jgi:hypothetical protein
MHKKKKHPENYFTGTDSHEACTHHQSLSDYKKIFVWLTIFR